MQTSKGMNMLVADSKRAKRMIAALNVFVFMGVIESDVVWAVKRGICKDLLTQEKLWVQQVFL